MSVEILQNEFPRTHRCSPGFSPVSTFLGQLGASSRQQAASSRGPETSSVWRLRGSQLVSGKSSQRELLAVVTFLVSTSQRSSRGLSTMSGSKIPSADKISAAEFQEYLDRYPSRLNAISESKGGTFSNQRPARLRMLTPLNSEGRPEDSGGARRVPIWRGSRFIFR